MHRRGIFKPIAETFATGPLGRLPQIGTVSLYRNSLYLIGASFTASSLGFLFWVTAARLYSTTEVGLGSAIIAAAGLLALFSEVGLNFAIVRFLSHAVRPQELVNSSFVLTGVIAASVALIFIFGTPLWTPALSIVRDQAPFFAAFLALTVLSTWSAVMDSAFMGARKAVFVLGRETIASVLKVALVAIFAFALHTFGVVASWTAALAVALAVAAFLFLPRVMDGYRPAPVLKLQRLDSLRSYATASYVASLLTRGPILILPIMVLNLLGPESNAYFYIAWMIANVLGTMTRSVSQSLFAEGSHLLESIQENAARSLRLTLVLTVPATLVLVAAGYWILRAFGVDYSQNAFGLLVLFSITSLPRGVVHVYSGILRARDRLRELLTIRAFIAIALLVPSYFMIPKYGIIVVGYAWLGVFVLVAIAIAPRLVREASRSGGPKDEVQEDVDNL